MENVQHNTLIKNWEYLVTNLQVREGLLDYLIQDEAISVDMMEAVMAERAPREQARTFLRSFMRCKFHAFDCLIRSLEKTQPFIAERLLTTFKELQSQAVASGTAASGGTTSPKTQEIDVENIPRQRFDIMRLIGRGGYGEVKLAFDTARHEDVVLKCINGPGAFSPHELKSLKTEAQLMRRARDEFVLNVFGVSIEPESGFCALVLPYMEQGSLRELLRNKKRSLPWPLRIRMLYQIARGMNSLHLLTPQLLHLNLKPGNVLLNERLDARIADFGLSRMYNVTKQTIQLREKSGSVTHIPPEAHENINLKPTPKFDIYSYALTVWEVLTRQVPYSNAGSHMQVAIAVMGGQRPDEKAVQLENIDPRYQIKTTVVPLMQNCWHQIPEKRPEFTEIVAKMKPLADKFKREADACTQRDGNSLQMKAGSAEEAEDCFTLTTKDARVAKSTMSQESTLKPDIQLEQAERQRGAATAIETTNAETLLMPLEQHSLELSDDRRTLDRNLPSGRPPDDLDSSAPINKEPQRQLPADSNHAPKMTAPCVTPASQDTLAAGTVNRTSFSKPLLTARPGFDTCVGLATTGPCLCAVSSSSLWLYNLQSKQEITHSLPGVGVSGVVSAPERPDSLVITCWSDVGWALFIFVRIDTKTLRITHETKSLSVSPGHLTTQGRRLIVADISGDVVICDRSGNVVDTVQFVQTVGCDIACVVAMADNQYMMLVKSSRDTYRLYSVGSDGTVKHVYGKGPSHDLKWPSHMILDKKTGQLLVADTGNNRVLVFGPDKQLQQIIERGPGRDSFYGPARLCLDHANGRLLVCHESRYCNHEAEIRIYRWPLKTHVETKLQESPPVTPTSSGLPS